MKLDPSDPVVQSIVRDDRPIALRKRRRSSACHSPERIASPKNNVPTLGQHFRGARTPSNRKKKVRFSDPGPELSPGSTGITPFVQRTSLQPIDLPAPKTPRLLERLPRRRASLPSIAASLEHSHPIEIQFPSLRQVLTPRTKRQIARNGLSEEMNHIETEHRTILKQEHELEELRDELTLVRRSCTAEPETIEDSGRIHQLGNENQVLKNHLQLPPVASEASSPSENLDDSVVMIDSDGIYVDPDCVLVNATPDQSAIPNTLKHGPKPNDHGNQTDLDSVTLRQLESHVANQTSHLVQARLDLERLFPGETCLPLSPPANGNCSPLLSAMLDHLRNVQHALQSTKVSLHTCQAQESNLRGQFNNALASLETTREAHAMLLKGAKAGAEKYAQARERIANLESEVDESNRSGEKLRVALDSYRTEIKSLESLITRMEEEGKQRIDTLNFEKDEAVADLECLVAAEMRGRREAEEELDARALQIQMLRNTEKELKKAISEKQGIVRNLESELEEVKQGREKEVGGLNAKISNIEESLSSAKQDIQRLEKEKVSLSKVVSGSQKREMKAVASLKEELRKALRGVEGVVGGWEKDAVTSGEGVKVGGLMTPTIEGGRFRDVATDSVEGAVRMQRGKSRRSRKIDSGIGILEEDVAAED